MSTHISPSGLHPEHWVQGCTAWDLAEARSATDPAGLTAVDEHGRSITFARLCDEAAEVAAALAARGVKPGDVVSWQLPTRIESLVLALALVRLGVVQNPIIPLYGERETRFVVAEAGARLLIVPEHWRGTDFGARSRRIADEVPGLDVLAIDGDLPRAEPGQLPRPATRPDDVRWLFYTSGTTANPKGARHTDASMIAVADGVASRLAAGSEDRNALVFPFTHIGGLMWMLASFRCGLVNIMIERFDQTETTRVLAEAGVTLVSGGTPLHSAFLAEQRKHPDIPLFPAARAFPGGASVKVPQLHYDIRDEMCEVGFIAGYGMTEAPMVVMTPLDAPDELKANTEGCATDGAEVRVVDALGEPVPAGVEGEIRVRGPQVMAGYVDRALDAEAFDGDGFLRTGDLGRQDEEGFLVVSGRIKDVIIRKGETISARDVEDVVGSHPDVAEVAVIGLPDPVLGERCCAVVVAETGQEVTLASIVQHLEGLGVMRQKFPEELVIVAQLPRTATGKVQKHTLRDAIVP